MVHNSVPPLTPIQLKRLTKAQQLWVSTNVRGCAAPPESVRVQEQLALHGSQLPQLSHLTARTSLLDSHRTTHISELSQLTARTSQLTSLSSRSSQLAAHNSHL